MYERVSLRPHIQGPVTHHNASLLCTRTAFHVSDLTLQARQTCKLNEAGKGSIRGLES